MMDLPFLHSTAADCPGRGCPPSHDRQEHVISVLEKPDCREPGQCPGMMDFPQYTTFDMNTIKPNPLPAPAAPRYPAGPAQNTISMINPAPAPTNTAIHMAEGRPVTKEAQWSRPSYDYTRTKSAEEEPSTQTIGAVLLASASLGLGIYVMTKLMGTDYDSSFLKGVSPTP